MARRRGRRRSSRGWRRFGGQALAALMAVALTVGTAAAQPSAEQRSGPTPPRLAFIDGDVSFWRPGAEDWAPAQVNTPLAEGDSLYTGDGGNLELQVGPRAFVRG